MYRTRLIRLPLCVVCWAENLVSPSSSLDVEIVLWKSSLIVKRLSKLTPVPEYST